MNQQRTTGGQVRLPETTRRTLTDFRKRVRQIKIAEGIFAGLFGLAVSWVVVFTADRFVDTPRLLRVLVLLAGALGFGLYFPLKCHRWVWGTQTMRQVAQLMRHRFPVLGDQVLGVVELVSGERELGDSHSLAVAAIDQVDSVVRETDFHDAVPRPRHRRWGIVAGVPLLLLILAVAVVPDAAWNALARWVMPWRNIDRYTFAQIEQLPDQMVVPHGESFTLAARLKDFSQWSPDTGKVWVSGQNVSAPRSDQDYTFEIPPQTQSGQLNVRIGDVRESVDIRPVPRPELISMTATVTLPEYLQYSRALTQDVRGGAVSLVKGSLVRFAAEVSRSLTSASIAGEEVATQRNTIVTSPQAVEESGILRFEWTDELGLSSKEPFPVSIRAVEDSKPGIGCIQEDPLHVVLSTDVIRFSLSADDDFGVRAMGLEWSGIHHPVHNPNPDTGHKVVTSGGPEERSLNAQTTFCAESDQVRPQSLKVRAWAEDYKPDRGRAWSPAFVLHVLTPQDHAVWLAQQLRRWASRADDVYEQEMRLHDANRELRRMDSAELQTREMQRRIRQQAASERSNAERLSQLTEQGDQLIRQAIRNPEMLVGHLETFAQALKKLREIAGWRMPSVADLLSDAAQTARKQAARPTTPSPTDPKELAPYAGNNRGNQSGQPKPLGENRKPPPVPGLVDTESGFNPQNPPSEDDEKQPPKSGSGKFGLPVTTLQGGPPDDQKKPPDQPDEKVDQAVEEQADLLAEFEKVREDLQKILDDLENSTFVKRLKAASRRQIDVASDLNRTLLRGFGVDHSRLEDRQTTQADRIAVREEEESRVIWIIKSDMQAYYGRRQEEKFRRIAEEMEELDIITQLGKLSGRVRKNLSGDSISRVEFWADTLDRWAEELVSQSKCGGCKACNGDSLPPPIVLEVMRILEGEIDLRDETRSLETSRAALEHRKYEESASRLYQTQIELHERTLAVLDDIRALPEGARRFGMELKIIGLAAAAIHDAADILSQPSTGPEAIAAETEAIELLLQSKHIDPNGGGGGGGSTPGGGGDGDTNSVALALHGPGSDPNAHIEAREIRQMTGTTGERLPEEFRDGLEAFFNAVENGN